MSHIRILISMLLLSVFSYAQSSNSTQGNIIQSQNSNPPVVSNRPEQSALKVGVGVNASQDEAKASLADKNNSNSNATFSNASASLNSTVVLNNQTLPNKTKSITPDQKVNLPRPSKGIIRRNPNMFYCGQSAGRRRKMLKQKANGRYRLVSTIYNFDMYVDAQDFTVSSTITATGTWQPNYINLIGYLVKEGDSVLNLGSQSGLEALIMGKIIGPTGNLYIFEPYSFSHSLVTKNVELNNLNNITTIYKIGASDEKSKAVIQISYANTGGSEIVSGNLKPRKGNVRSVYSEEESVDLDRVDSLLPPDVSLDFALLDVEKMEIKALKGMKAVIQRSPNLIIMTEWQYARNPRRNKEETLQLLTYMVEKGYKIYSYRGGNVRTCKTGSFHQFGKIEDLLRIDFLDIFFIPKDYRWPQ